MTTESDYRLPRAVTPRHYQLIFTPDLGDATFHGSAAIDVTVHQSVEEITLNSLDLEIGPVTVDTGNERIPASSVEYDTDRQRAVLRFPSALAPGVGTLRLDFQGDLNDKLQGFYRSTYKTAGGETQTIATTQFESTDARRAFPCWDEPDLKATFGITLVVPEGLMAVSNAPIVGSQPRDGGLVEYRFADTMVMSTYLVAMIVGELEATEPVDVDGVPLRIIHVPGKAHLADFGLEFGAYALRYFADYYGIPYPGSKVDMIGIPDFAWGAMENLGAITYRETALLVDPATATQGELARVADVIAHELAHMWFGDLVTMKWWNGIWLNEAFASFMETKCVAAFRPDWKRWLAFSGSRVHAMDVDALETTRPVEFPVGSPSEANEMFDTLTYGKGQAVLRMLEVYLGEDTFRNGIVRYLKSHAYGNTETADLLRALEAESEQPVGEIMHEWIFEGGFPRLDVSLTDDGYDISQEHFRYLGSGSTRWQVPVLYRTEEGDGRILVGELARLPSSDRLLLNARGQGFYRVRYSPDLLARLIPQLSELASEERYAIVSDTLANVLAGDTVAAEFVDLAGGLAGEREPDVWSITLAGFSELDRVVSSDARPWLQTTVRDLVGPALERVGWEPAGGETDLERRLRGILIEAMGILGADRRTRERTAAVLEQWLGDRDSIDGEVGAASVHVVARSGDETRFDQFVELYRDASSPQDEVRFLRAAAAVPLPETGGKLLDMVATGDVRSQDATGVIARLIGHRDIGPAMWELVKSRWDAVVAAPPPQVARHMLDTIPYRSEPDVAADIASWLAAHPLPGGSSHMARQLERLRVRVGLREREAPRLGPWA